MLYMLAIFYGLIIGNYLTSAYFRIPRLIPINGLNNQVGQKPHCSVCKHKLEFYEYFPVFNWFCVGLNCNYCHSPINPMYTIIEISMTIFSVILFYLLGMSMLYVFSILLAAAILLNITLFWSYRKFYLKSLAGLMVLAFSLSYVLYYR